MSRVTDFLAWIGTIGVYKIFTVFMGLVFQLILVGAVVFGVLRVLGL